MANEKLVNRENLKAFREKYDDRLTSGQLVVSKSLTAKELETISLESGDIQETPFALQGTGTANGTSSVDTGTVGKHIQKQGSVYCVNQLVQNGNFADGTSGWLNEHLTITANNNKLTGVCSDSYNGVSIFRRIGFVSWHKYLVCATLKSSVVPEFARIQLMSSGYSSVGYIDQVYSQSTKTKITGIITPSASDDNGFIFIRTYATWNANDTFEVENVMSVDLTQWFNGNIPQDLLDHPEHWVWYQTYGDYIAYNTGTLVSGNGKYLVCGGRNLFDGELEKGLLTNGQQVSSDYGLRTKNYIHVIPNKEYDWENDTNISFNGFYISEYDSDKVFIKETRLYASPNNKITLSANTYYIKFHYYSSTPYSSVPTNPQITISIYYAGEDYSQYCPYEQPKVYYTGIETLLSTGVKLSVSGEREDIYDYKEPNGLITRRVGKVKLKDLNWTYDSRGFMRAVLTGINTIQANWSNLMCPNYVVSTSKYGGDTKTNKTIGGLISTKEIFVADSSYTDATTFTNHFTDNDYLYYELATPTTEQGTPFSENIEINDFGTMGWYATYTDANTNALVSVPQGCKIFYPAWYVGFIDTLGQRADIDWNANNVVSQSELSTKQDANTIQATSLENQKFIMRQLLATSKSLNVDNVLAIDMGTLTYEKATVNSRTVFRAVLTNCKQSTSDNVAQNILCSLYSVKSYTAIYSGSADNSIALRGISPEGIIIKDSSKDSYTTDQFKNAMKGILLAYEKAS